RRELRMGARSRPATDDPACPEPHRANIVPVLVIDRDVGSQIAHARDAEPWSHEERRALVVEDRLGRVGGRDVHDEPVTAATSEPRKEAHRKVGLVTGREGPPFLAQRRLYLI